MLSESHDSQLRANVVFKDKTGVRDWSNSFLVREKTALRCKQLVVRDVVTEIVTLLTLQMARLARAHRRRSRVLALARTGAGAAVP